MRLWFGCVALKDAGQSIACFHVPATTVCAVCDYYYDTVVSEEYGTTTTVVRMICSWQLVTLNFALCRNRIIAPTSFTVSPTLCSAILLQPTAGSDNISRSLSHPPSVTHDPHFEVRRAL